MNILKHYLPRRQRPLSPTLCRWRVRLPVSTNHQLVCRFKCHNDFLQLPEGDGEPIKDAEKGGGGVSDGRARQ
jgi:hypothetical protein